MKTSVILLLSILTITFAGCDFYSQDTYQEQYVVQGYLEANAPLKAVHLSKTIPITETYNANTVAISDATVEVRLLDRNGQVAETFSYLASRDSAGLYVATSFHEVLPNRTYELFITRATDTIKAQTTIPNTISFVGINNTALAYQGNEVFEIEITASKHPNRQGIYIFSVLSLEPLVDNLVPLYHPETTPFEDIKPPVLYSSPILNEGNYVQNTSGTVSIRFPWLAVAFYGRNRVSANAIDDNIYDFFRSQSIQQGGSTLSPGEIPNAIYHIEGGIGIFGSYASISTEIEVLR